jgi:phospholipase C
MTNRRAAFARRAAVVLLLAALPSLVGAQRMVEDQPRGSEAVRALLTDPDTPPLSPAEKIALLRQRVKHVFVVYQENRSFDSYFGTFPGARGFFSQAADATPGLEQPLMDTDGSMTTIKPFRIGPEVFAADLDDVGHNYAVMRAKMNVTDGRPRMDRFALVEEMSRTKPGDKPSLAAKQFGELTMAYQDCDTVPFLWHYADHFVLFDSFFQHTIGPSAPAAINAIAAQTGETQWVKHPADALFAPDHLAAGAGVPVLSDDNPVWGSAADPSGRGQPTNPRETFRPNINQTYASLPLSLAGGTVGNLVQTDRDPDRDLMDVRRDISTIASRGKHRVAWGWYQEGYAREPTDPPSAPAGGSHTSYIPHHNGPQYFGYVANNPAFAANLHGLEAFFGDIKAAALPAAGGLFYVRGGYENIAGLFPVNPDPSVRLKFRGDDDHPGYADSEISEALVARVVNAIARSPYWSDSVVIITYDESTGEYDHVPPPIVETGPGDLPLSRGPRIPLIVISPFARVHAVSHESSDHASLVRLVDTIFDLTPLADLPEELDSRMMGEKTLGLVNLGPADDLTPGVGDLLSAFDDSRLAGRKPPLPPSWAEIPDEVVDALPHYGGQGCGALGIVPEDVARGVANSLPSDFNPRPATSPTTR